MALPVGESLHCMNINSKSVPDLEVCPLNKADIQSLDFCVHRLLMKLFCTNHLSMVEECRHYFSIALSSELLCKHTGKFVLTAQAECQLRLTAVHIRHNRVYRHLFYFILFI